MCGVRAYSVSGQDGDNVPADKIYGGVSFTVAAAGQVYKQTVECVCLGGAVSADRELRVDTTRRLQRPWACLQWYKMEN